MLLDAFVQTLVFGDVLILLVDEVAELHQDVGREFFSGDFGKTIYYKEAAEFGADNLDVLLAVFLSR